MFKHDPEVQARLETARDLRAAADRIEEVGWWDGSSPSPQDEDCALMSVSEVIRVRWGVDEYYPHMNAATAALEAHLGCDVATWNDEQPNQEPVLRALRETAEGLERG